MEINIKEALDLLNKILTKYLSLGIKDFGTYVKLPDNCRLKIVCEKNNGHE